MRGRVSEGPRQHGPYDARHSQARGGRHREGGDDSGSMCRSLSLCVCPRLSHAGGGSEACLLNVDPRCIPRAHHLRHVSAPQRLQHVQVWPACGHVGTGTGTQRPNTAAAAATAAAPVSNKEETVGEWPCVPAVLGHSWRHTVSLGPCVVLFASRPGGSDGIRVTRRRQGGVVFCSWGCGGGGPGKCLFNLWHGVIKVLLAEHKVLA